MSDISFSMSHYFQKLVTLWKKLMNCNPLYSWDEADDTALFLTEPEGENAEREWLPMSVAPPAGLPELCDELRDFFGCYRFWSMEGRLNDDVFFIPAVPTDAQAILNAETAIRIGEYYMGPGYARLAYVEHDGNDDCLLMYHQETGKLSIYDKDLETTTELAITLSALIDQMEALI